MRRKPHILQSRTIAQTRLFTVEQVDLRFSNGVTARYEKLVSSPYGAVLIVPITADEEVLLVREYAAGVHRYELGLPKGRVEADEDILQAANREIMEEIGFGGRRLEQITALTVAPGYFDHTTHIVVARDLFEQRADGDEPEELEIVRWPLHAIEALVARQDVSEARSIAALFLAREHCKRV